MRWHLKIPTMMHYLNNAQRNGESVQVMLQNSGLPSLHITYDTLRKAPETWCLVLNHLGISCADMILLRSSLKKDITKSRDHVIKNYLEVERALMGTKFEWMLNA